MGNVFLGLPIPAAIIESCLTTIFNKYPHWQAHTSLRWTKLGHHHMTLHFFGVINIELLSVFINDLDNYLHNFKNFYFKINKLDVFPDENSKILAAYVTLSSPLAKFYHILQKAVSDHQFLSEQRPYSPHITLCRAKRHGILTTEPFYLDDCTIPAKELILYQTQSTPTGSHYVPIHKWTLS